jgi:hypothetical protein
MPRTSSTFNDMPITRREKPEAKTKPVLVQTESTMHCGSCSVGIRVLINSEMICFKCYDARKAATPIRHRTLTPSPIESLNRLTLE